MAIGGLAVIIVIAAISSFLWYGGRIDKESIGKSDTQTPNPWHDAKSIEEAEEEIGFDLEKFSYLPDGYNQEAVIFFKEERGAVVRELAKNQANERIILEKKNDIIKEDGDYSAYTKEEKVTLGNKEIVMKYKDEKLKKAKWDMNNYTYSIISDAEIKKEEMLKIIAGLEG